jgi:hypothetical protein
MDKAAGGIVGILAGIYLVRVALAGNARPLLEMLKEETGYLELLVALYLIYLLHKNKVTGEFTDQLLLAAAIAATLKVVTSNANVVEEFQKFGSGQQTLFETAGNLFGL